MFIKSVFERLKIAEALPWFLAFSGGKDSTVLLDIVYRYGKSFAVIHNEELLKLPVHFEWVYGVLSRLAENGVDVHVVVQRRTTSLWSSRRGIHRQDTPSCGARRGSSLAQRRA